MSGRIHTHTTYPTSRLGCSVPKAATAKSVSETGALAFDGKQFASTSTLIRFPIISTVHNANSTEIYLTKEVAVPFFFNFRQNYTGFWFIRSPLAESPGFEKPETMSLQFVPRLNACHSITHNFLPLFLLMPPPLLLLLLLPMLLLCVNFESVEYVERLSKQQNHQKVQQQCLLSHNTKDDECHIHGVDTSNI